MKWRHKTFVLALGLGITACGGDEEPSATPADTTPGQAAQAAPDTDQQAAAPQQPVQRAPVRQEPPPGPPRPTADEPWNPVDTGTVDPGMTRERVIAIWGVPVAERQANGRTYLYFRNGCEYSCGTFDVVFFQDDQVVDAIVRGPGHHYSGRSSSPPGREPSPTPPEGGMTMPPASDSTPTSNGS